MSGCILLAAALALVGCTTPAPAAPAQLDSMMVKQAGEVRPER